MVRARICIPFLLRKKVDQLFITNQQRDEKQCWMNIQALVTTDKMPEFFSYLGG